MLFQDGPVLIINPENKNLLSKVHKNYYPSLTLLGLGGETDRSINSKLTDINLEPGKAVLLKDGEVKVVVSSIEDLEQNL